MEEALRERADRGLPVFASELTVGDVLIRRCGCELKFVGPTDGDRYELEFDNGLLCETGCPKDEDLVEGARWEFDSSVEVRYASCMAEVRAEMHEMYYKDNEGRLCQYKGRLVHEEKNVVRDLAGDLETRPE